MEHLVEFEKYCKKCEYYLKDSTKNPCNECSNEPAREDSKKPLRYKENENWKPANEYEKAIDDWEKKNICVKKKEENI